MIQEVVGSSSAPITKAENVRCPRCDSSNTKFCYYNNYNLTQPRHFCKSCRRYWTKGGTLRNVPIGGGCRKNKTTTTTTHVVAKAALSTEMLLNGSSGFLGNGLLDPYSDLQSSNILAFLNPNPNPSFFTSLKTEGNTPYGSGAPSILGSFLRGNQHPLNGFGFGFGAPDVVQNGGNSTSNNILELYQRMKSSGNYNYYGNVMGSAPSSPSLSPSATISSIMEASNGGGDNLGGYGMMSSSLGISGWSDFPQVPINGAFP